jgi:hypothetical protein
MANSANSRRELLLWTASVGLGGALFSGDTFAQTGNKIEISLKKFSIGEAGREHSNQLEQIEKTLGGDAVLSGEGLSRLVDRLLAMKLISEKDTATLKKLISEVVHATSTEALTSRIANTFKALSNQVGEVAQAVIRITNDSIQYARRVSSSVDIKVLIRVVSSDIMGALSGAATGGQLGGPSGALIGAVLGAVSSSALSVFEAKR